MTLSKFYNREVLRLCTLSLAAAVFLCSASLEQAERDFQAGRFKQVRSACRGAIRQNLEPERARAILIRTLLKIDRIAEASHEAEAAVAAFPKNPLLLALLGEVRFRMGHLDAAGELHRSALRLEPRQPRALLGLGKVLDAEFQRGGAAELFEQAHSTAPDDPDVLYQWAGILQSRAEEAASLRRWLVLATNEDKSRREEVAARVEVLEALGGRRTFVMTDPPQSAVLPLESLPGESGKPAGVAVRFSFGGAPPVRLLLDTGATGLTLAEKAARRCGLTRIASGRIRGIGDEGPQKTWHALAGEVRAGELSFRDCLVNVTRSTLRGSVDGVAGADLFSRYLVTLDYPAGQVRLTDLRADPDEEALADRVIPAGREHFLRLHHLGHLLLVRATLNTTASGWFLIDSGAYTNVVALELARRAAVVRVSDKLRIRGASGRANTAWSTGEATPRVRRRPAAIPLTGLPGFP